jgi:pimeloyl-ACP methyl ester carboxylesterase
MGAKSRLCAFALAAFPPHCQPPAWLDWASSRSTRELDGVAATAPERANVSPHAKQFTHMTSIRMEPLSESSTAAGSPPTFVMRGEPHGPGRMAFIHGMCGHALGYAQSFQWSAAKYGALVAPQGDVPCSPGSPWAKWSVDTAALDARIMAAFRELGSAEPIDDITLIGYSQGASRAEALARRWPKRYTRLILIAGPSKVSPAGLAVQSALMMAGSLDRQDLMQGSARAFVAAGRRARYMQLPNARHGAMGDTPEQTMDAALSWLYGPATSPAKN